MKVSWSGSSFEAPEGWKDATMLTFMAPAEGSGGIVGEAGSPGNVVVELRAEGKSPAAALDERLQQIATQTRGFSVLSRKEEHGILHAVFSYEAGMPIKQVIFVKALGAKLAVITGTARSRSFDSLLPMFTKVATSLA